MLHQLVVGGADSSSAGRVAVRGQSGGWQCPPPATLATLPAEGFVVAHASTCCQGKLEECALFVLRNRSGGHVACKLSLVFTIHCKILRHQHVVIALL
jgi:hypothetical protein